MGIPDRMFKRHGRWKSENAKDGYIQDTLENQLSESGPVAVSYLESISAAPGITFSLFILFVFHVIIVTQLRMLLYRT